MNTARCIVCEKSGQWAIALRQCRDLDSDRLLETRSLLQCWEELDARPGSALLLEVRTDNLESLVERLAGLRNEYRSSIAMVVGDRRLRPCELLLRESGAIHAQFSPRRLEPAARLLKRHLARSRQAELSWPEEVRQRLPWAPSTA